MPNTILDGLSLVNPIGRAILLTTVATLFLSITASLAARSRYEELLADLAENAAPSPRFLHRVLNDIARSAQAAAQRSPEPNTQAIIEDHVHSGLKGLLLTERFVRIGHGPRHHPGAPRHVLRTHVVHREARSTSSRGIPAPSPT